MSKTVKVRKQPARGEDNADNNEQPALFARGIDAEMAVYEKDRSLLGVARCQGAGFTDGAAVSTPDEAALVAEVRRVVHDKHELIAAGYLVSSPGLELDVIDTLLALAEEALKSRPVVEAAVEVRNQDERGSRNAVHFALVKLYAALDAAAEGKA